MRASHYLLALLAAVVSIGQAPAPPTPPATTGGTITGEVKAFKGGKRIGTKDVWVYLDPVERPKGKRAGDGLRGTMDQRSITFTPRIVVVPVGATVTFPNRDNMIHNVFSPERRERDGFDLGEYGRNATGRSRRFLETGEYAIYCNIHARMSATVKVVPTRHFVQVAADGSYTLAGVRPGTYRAVAWTEASRDVSSDELVITEGGSVSVQPLHLQVVDPPATHLNKDGEPYDIYDR